MTAEFSLKLPLAKLGSRPTPVHVEAGPDACAALAARFGLQALDRLVADLEVTRDGAGARLAGRFEADAVQICIVSGEPLPVTLAETIALGFQPDTAAPGTEIELEPEALDTLPLEGETIDVGEAVAQSLLLALDPYPRAPDAVLAAARRHIQSEEEAARAEAAAKAAASPFARLRPQ